MLEHDNLEEFQDPPSYDLEDPSDTGLAFYLALAQETGSPILELGCGTGRITIPLAQEGFVLTGVDRVPVMLAHACHKADSLPIHWLAADARALPLKAQFKLIYLTGNTFQLFLTSQDQIALLSAVYQGLHPEGYFAFETRNPQWPAREGAPDEMESTREENRIGRPLFSTLETRLQDHYWGAYRDSDGNKIRLSRIQQYDPDTQLLHWTTDRRWYALGQPHTKVSRITVRFTGSQALEKLLVSKGFEILRQFGDWDYSPVTRDSPSIIVVCRKKENLDVEG